MSQETTNNDQKHIEDTETQNQDTSVEQDTVTRHLTELAFSDLVLHDALQQGLRDANFAYCTPIQAQALPLALKATDIAGQAQTGTGKTIAFLLAASQYLLEKPLKSDEQNNSIRCLILAPTRELAIQIHKEAAIITKHTELSLGLVYGGTTYDTQINELSGGCDIVIGTPGRLIDLHKQKLLPLDKLQVLVLDEADRMFDLGFIKDIRYLIRKMPDAKARFNLLFSATLSYRVMELAYEHLNAPTEIKIESETIVADNIDEYCFYPAQDEKATLLVNLMRSLSIEKAVVFVNTKHTADFISRVLKANEIGYSTLSGDVPQKKRERMLSQFKSGQFNILVATDVAARGLHVSGVTHVINYDLPQDADDYVHRIGRTARAGESGVAISFVCEKYAYSIFDIEQQIGHALAKKPIDEALLKPINPPAQAEQTAKATNKRAKSTKSSQKKAPTQKRQQQSLPDIPLKMPEKRFSPRFGEIPVIG